MMPDVRDNAVSNSSNPSPDKLEEATWQLKIEDGQEGSDGQLSPYPDRPGEPDCLYYLRTGACGYGSKCRYNHPNHTGQDTQFGGELPQRDGQPDCQFFIKTGTCKYGTTCKYHHPRDKHNTKLVQLNVLGLPIRKDEKSCAYYMKTGSCKYGVACKFNHPQPASHGMAFPVSGSSTYGYPTSVTPTSGPPAISGISPYPISRIPCVSTPRLQDLQAYVPLVLSPTQGNMVLQQGWSTYMGNTNHIYSTHMLPSPVANSKHQEQPGSSLPLNLPERPDQPECQFYLKTGNCKYGSSCKYHHPRERNQASIATIGPLGLPLRPGEPVCTFYTTYGSCKYGTACKFDHPLIGYYGYSMPSFSYPDPSAALFPSSQRSTTAQVFCTSAENSSSRSSKFPDQISRNETTTSNAQHNPQNHERGAAASMRTPMSNTNPCPPPASQ